MPQNQTRVNVYVDNEVLAKFDKMHPMQGARTRFVRAAFESHIKNFAKKADDLLEVNDKEEK